MQLQAAMDYETGEACSEYHSEYFGRSSRQGRFSPSLSQNRTWSSHFIRLVSY